MGFHLVLWSALPLFAWGLAIPESFPKALDSITTHCVTPASLSECTAFANEALAICSNSDLSCHCTQFSAIADYCSTRCEFNKTELLDNSTFMTVHCNKIEWSPSTSLQAAGILDRIRAHHNRGDSDDDEEETDADDRDHSTCNNGDDSDPGTNWMNYPRRSLNRRSENPADHADADTATAVPSECWDLETARKHVVQEAVSIAAHTPRKNLEKFVDNMLSKVPFKKSSGSSTDYHYTETDQASESDQQADHDNSQETVEVDTDATTENSEEDSTLFAPPDSAEESTSSPSFTPNESEPDIEEAKKTSDTISPPVISEEPRTSHYIISSGVIPSLESKTTSSIQHSSSFEHTPFETSTFLTTKATLSSSFIESVTAVTSSSPVPFLEPPSLTIARAFSLADELAMQEEKEAENSEYRSEDDNVITAMNEQDDDGWHEAENLNDEEGWNELQFASAVSAKYLSQSALSKEGSPTSSASHPTISPKTTWLVAAQSVDDLKLNGTNNTFEAHMRPGNETNSTLSSSSNSTESAQKSKHSHSTSGASTKKVSFALLLAVIAAMVFIE